MTNRTATLLTVGDITAIIALMLAETTVRAWPNGPTLSEYAQSLFGARKRGSTTEFGLSKLPEDREIVEFTPPEGVAQAGSRYFRVHAPELVGRLGAVALGSGAIRNPDADSTHEVVWADGPHGPELRLVVKGWDDEIVPFTEMFGDLPVAEDITVVVSDVEGFGPVVATWHPGEPLGTCKPFEGKPVAEIPEYVAVKLTY